MTAKIDRKHTRATIEKIRQSIDTDLAIRTLNEIMNNVKVPPTVRVKAASTLLDKTMPSLTASEITTIKDETDPAQILEQLKPILGKEVYDKLMQMYMPVDQVLQ